MLFGDAGTGKTALVSQFMTSEYMHTYDASLGKFKRNVSPSHCGLLFLWLCCRNFEMFNLIVQLIIMVKDMA